MRDREMKRRAIAFLMAGYSADRTSEITGMTKTECRALKVSGLWP